jgi:hypothetical protein
VQNATANIVQIKTAVGAAFDCPPLSHSYINCNDSDVVVGRSITNGANTITSNAAPFNSPAFTGTPTAPTAAVNTNTTQIATTAFVNAEIANDTANLAPLASPAFTGVPTAPTAAVTTNTTQLATTAFVNAEIANDAPTKTGGGASGTWGIDISGNAATATSATSATTATNQSGGTVSATNVSYSGTLTGGTGVVNLGSNQFYKDASGNIGLGVVPRTTWKAISKVIEMPSGISIAGIDLFFYQFSGLYFGTDSNFRYTGSNPGGYFYNANGNFAFARSLFTATPDAIAVTTNMLSMSQSTGVVDIGSAAMGSATFSFSMNPLTDNAISCGAASKRWTIVYATTGTINTSDARHKTPVRSLNNLEIAAAQELASEIGAFQWLEAVEKKGAAARLHIGLTVQRVMQIMEKHSLDPFAYGFVCFDEWEDIINEDGVKTQEKGDAYSLRPDQLSLFIAKGQQVSMQNLSAQLEEIKAQLAAMKA